MIQVDAFAMIKFHSIPTLFDTVRQDKLFIGQNGLIHPFMSTVAAYKDQVKRCTLRRLLGLINKSSSEQIESISL